MNLKTMSVVALFVVLALSTALSVRMEPSAFGDMINALTQLDLIVDVPMTAADFYAMVRLNVSEPPECPFANELFSCDDSGSLKYLNLNAPPLKPMQARRFSLGSFQNDGRLGVPALVRLSNFVGELSFVPTTYRSVEIYDSIIVNATRPACSSVGCVFLASLNAFSIPEVAFVMSNVTILDSDKPPAGNSLPSAQSLAAKCTFRNVTMACPVPQWLARCFNVTDAAMVPCVAPIANASASFVRVPEPCLTEFDLCSLTCSPPPLNEFVCFDSTIRNIVLQGNIKYFPGTPGFSTIEAFFYHVGVAVSLSLQSKTTGIIARIEIFNWRTLNWTVLEFPNATRTDAEMGGREVAKGEIMLPPVLTNRVRVTLEQWYVDTEVVTNFVVTRTLFGKQPQKTIQTSRRCAVPESFSARSNLDESLGDSYCIGRICQLACQFAANFTFDRAVVPQFVVIDGGSLWPGAELIATPSDQTRVYRYNVTASAISFLNISADLGSVSRVRLIGDPARNEPLPTPTLPPRGFPGIMIKRWFRGLPVGFANVTNVAPIATCPQLPANVMSSARVSNSSFVFTTDGNLLQCSATSWEPVVVKLTAPILNRDAPVLSRKLVAIGDRLLGVIVASNILHDGTVNRLLVNRRIVSTAIDVFDVRTRLWFVNSIQHDIRCCNISDVDVVVNQNQSAFGVVDRWSGAASVLEWRPFSYELVDCSSNSDCRTCLTNEANVERCRWCDSRCTAQLTSCFPNETSTINVMMCKMVESTAATTTTTTTTTTTNRTTASPSDNSSSSIVEFSSVSLLNGSFAMVNDGDAAVPLLPLFAVVGAFGGLAVIGAIVALIWKIRKNRNNGGGDGNDANAGDVQRANRDADGHATSERYSAFDEDPNAHAEGAYDDSSALN